MHILVNRYRTQALHPRSLKQTTAQHGQPCDVTSHDAQANRVKEGVSRHQVTLYEQTPMHATPRPSRQGTHKKPCKTPEHPFLMSHTYAVTHTYTLLHTHAHTHTHTHTQQQQYCTCELKSSSCKGALTCKGTPPFCSSPSRGDDELGSAGLMAANGKPSCMLMYGIKCSGWCRAKIWRRR